MAVKRGPKPQFTREEFLDAALSVADREGLSALNVRRLAAELGVATGTLYKYFEDMRSLLDGVFVRAVEGLEGEVELGDDWREDLARAIRAIHARFSRHPAIVELLMHGVSGPEMDHVREELLRILEAAGLDPPARLEALSLLLANVVGSVVMVHLRGGDFRSAELTRRASLPESEFPRLVHASRAVLAAGYPDLHERGLQAIIASLETPASSG